MLIQIVVYILGIVATYRLWGSVVWLSVVTILLILSYSVHPSEQHEQNVTGKFSNATATRLAWTAGLILIIFLYSLFV